MCLDGAAAASMEPLTELAKETASGCSELMLIDSLPVSLFVEPKSLSCLKVSEVYGYEDTQTQI